MAANGMYNVKFAFAAFVEACTAFCYVVCSFIRPLTCADVILIESDVCYLCERERAHHSADKILNRCKKM